MRWPEWKWVVCVTLLVAAGWQMAAHAAQRPMYFRHLTLQDGLSQATIMAVHQDTQGFIWLGSQNGLNRYDGYDIVRYHRDRNDPHALASDFIWQIAEDDNTDLWFATMDGGVARWTRATDRFQNYRHDPQDASTLASDAVRTLTVARDGMIWVGLSEHGVNVLNPVDGTVERFAHDPDDPASLSSNAVFEVHQDKAGSIWVATDGGLNLFNPRSRSFVRYEHDPDDESSISSNAVRTVYEDKEGGLWIGTMDAGLNRLNRLSGRFTRYATSDDPTSLSHPYVRVIFEDDAKRLWVGTADGLNLFDRQRQTFQRFYNDQSPQGLSHSYIMAIYQDRGGLLWVGTRSSGVNIWNPRSWSLGHYTADWMQDNNVTAFATRGERLWVGTFNQGLMYLENGLEKANYRASQLGVDRVMSLLLDRQDRLWIGTMDGGLSRLDVTTEDIVSFHPDPDNPASLSANDVMSLLEDRKGRIWIGTYGGGLNRYDEETNGFHEFGPEHGLSGSRATSLAEDLDGYLWVGTDEGLNRLDPETGEILQFLSDPQVDNSLSSNTVYALHVDSGGTLWVGTAGGGLNRAVFDGRGNVSFARISQAEGLPSNVIYGIRSDLQGRLWLSTNNGLARLDPSNGRIKRFHKEHGLQDEEFNFGAHHTSEWGVLYFGGAEGFNAIVPSRLEENDHVPKMVLTSLLTMNKEAETPVPFAALERYDAAHDANALTFEFAALDFTAPSQNRYSYTLEGFDTAWTTPSPVRRASYTNLDAGEYVFRVKAANSDGVWNDIGLALPVTVAPAPWQTNWAYAGYVLIALVLSTLALRAQFLKRRRELSYRRQLYKLAYFDNLTGIGNRQLFMNNLKNTLRRMGPQGTKLAVMYLDLDEFKRINDALGHRAGDAVLKLVAKRLQAVMEKAGRAYPNLTFDLARLGGDEFVIVVGGFKDEKVVEQIAQRTLEFLAKPLNYNRYELVITPSVGISVYPDDGASMQSLMKNADTALHDAKSTGRNEYKFYSRVMNARGLEDLALEGELRKALENDALHMVYQPKVDMRSGMTVGAEALIRWEHPEKGPISPEVFIRLAERRGLILDIDQWVVNQVISQVGSWLRDGVDMVPVALNLSGREFVDKGLVWSLSKVADEAGVPTGLIEIEITESVLASDAEAAKTTVSKLRSMGFGVAIDDFGTGYSSLSYLKNFAVSSLKIDRSFVKDICEDADDRAICAAIVAMAKGLGIKSVAEGVETREQLDLLCEQGCDYAQGYYFHKPLAADEFQALLESRRRVQPITPTSVKIESV